MLSKSAVNAQAVFYDSDMDKEGESREGGREGRKEGGREGGKKDSEFLCVSLFLSLSSNAT